jgi:type IV pilus assembly protein PilA
MLSKLQKKVRGFTLIELMIVVAIIGILAAIAIPNFIRFQAKSKQSEAKTNLKAVFTAQRAYFGEKDRYGSSFDKIGFQPEKGNRYTYTMGAATIGTDTARFSAPGAIEGNFSVTGPATSTVTGVQGSCPSCVFAATAHGNVDNDSASDSWVIASDTVSSSTSGESAAGGASLVMQDDVSTN